MTAERTSIDNQRAKLAAKLAYSRTGQRKLLEIRARLIRVDAKISNALASGVLRRTGQLEATQRAVDLNLAKTAERLEALRKSEVQVWHQHENSVEDAWEDLFRSIRNLLAHFSNDAR